MGNLVTLSSAIKTVLATVIVDDNGNHFSDLQEAPSTDFAGYPAATVSPSTVDSDYAMNNSNLRWYGFYVDVFYPIQDPNSANGIAAAFSAMRGFMDNTLDAFDMSNTLGGACQMLRPVPSVWSVVEGGTSLLLTARITLKCAITVSTNNG